MSIKIATRLVDMNATLGQNFVEATVRTQKKSVCKMMYFGNGVPLNGKMSKILSTNFAI
jgi:hypothetical protein